jgi:hypothetical protein
MKRKVTAVASLALATSIALNVYAWNDHEGTKITPVETPHYVDKQAVINALSTKAEIVGLTGKVSKTIEYKDGSNGTETKRISWRQPARLS